MTLFYNKGREWNGENGRRGFLAPNIWSDQSFGNHFLRTMHSISYDSRHILYSFGPDNRWKLYRNA